jgi:hypothetical protein
MTASLLLYLSEDDFCRNLPNVKFQQLLVQVPESFESNFEGNKTNNDSTISRNPHYGELCGFHRVPGMNMFLISLPFSNTLHLTYRPQLVVHTSYKEWLLLGCYAVWLL